MLCLTAKKAGRTKRWNMWVGHNNNNVCAPIMGGDIRFGGAALRITCNGGPSSSKHNSYFIVLRSGFATKHRRRKWVGVQNPRLWEISWASGGVFSNTSLLSAVYGPSNALATPWCMSRKNTDFNAHDRKSVANKQTNSLKRLLRFSYLNKVSRAYQCSVSKFNA